MKYIEKHFDAVEVKAFEAQLKADRLDKVSLANPNNHPASDGPAVYKMVGSFPTFQGLKDRMFADQGGICCYCGCRLQYPSHPQYIVEHVFPKDKDRTLAGEYENLLLSCRPSDDVESLPKRERKNLYHCDKSKESKIIAITPLQPDCSSHFIYDEFGGITGAEKGDDEVIDTLNLGSEWLRKRREAAIEGEIYDEDLNLLDAEALRQRLDSIMRVDEQGMHSEFCFVIKDVIEHLLSDEL